MQTLLILSIIGVYSKAPEYLSIINVYVKIYISIFLIIYFNPYSKHKFTDFDREIVFRAGIFLLFSTTLIQILIYNTSYEINTKLYEVNKSNNRIPNYELH
jgi:low affinity Fe/Cu permease